MGSQTLSQPKDTPPNIVVCGGHRENWGESNMDDASPRTDTSTDDTDDKNQRLERNQSIVVAASDSSDKSKEKSEDQKTCPKSRSCQEKSTTEEIDEIFEKVLPLKSGYSRGRGPGPKPLSKAHRAAKEQQKEVEERANTVEKLNEELLQQMAELKARQDGLEASISEKLRDEIRQHFEEQGWNNNSLPSFMNGSVFNYD